MAKKKARKPDCELAKLYSRIDTKIRNGGATKLNDEEWDYYLIRMMVETAGQIPKWARERYHGFDDEDTAKQRILQNVN